MRQKNNPFWSLKVWVTPPFLSSLLAACLHIIGLRNARNAVSDNLIFKIFPGAWIPKGLSPGRSFGSSPRAIPTSGKKSLATGLNRNLYHSITIKSSCLWGTVDAFLNGGPSSNHFLLTFFTFLNSFSPFLNVFSPSCFWTKETF